VYAFRFAQSAGVEFCTEPIDFSVDLVELAKDGVRSRVKRI
jgi:hypothetical protein